MWFKKIFDFFVFSSLFIAVCAVLMVYQTFLLFDLHVSIRLLLFVFFGSVCSYNFHWYLTPPNVKNASEKTLWNINYKHVHLILFLIGLAGAAVCGLLLIKHWFWLGVTGFLTFLYSAPKVEHPFFIFLRKIAIGKTIFLAFGWTMITVILPMVTNTVRLSNAEILFVINRFFFLYAICIVFDRRDVEDDRKAGIKSLITFLSEKGIDILFWCSMAVFVISSVLLLKYFSALQISALLFPGLLLSMLYYPSKKNFSDYLYYFVLDGLMMLSAPLLILITFAR